MRTVSPGTISRLTLVILAMACLLPRPAQAGFIDIRLGSEHAGFSWQLASDESGNALVDIYEMFTADITDPYELSFEGETDSDPVISITKSVLNLSGSTWFGYSINLDPLQSATFTGTASSNVFALISQTDHNLTFGPPGSVLPGESVSFMFDILIPDAGPFEFSLDQSPTEPIPEPATGTLLVLGLLAASRSFRRPHIRGPR